MFPSEGGELWPKKLREVLRKWISQFSLENRVNELKKLPLGNLQKSPILNSGIFIFYRMTRFLLFYFGRFGVLYFQKDIKANVRCLYKESDPWCFYKNTSIFLQKLRRYFGFQLNTIYEDSLTCVSLNTMKQIKVCYTLI